MIAFLRGVLARKTASAVIIECGGVGYEALASLSAIERLPEEGENVCMPATLVVREDSHTLYAFSDERERAIFLRLIKVSGVGAKTALALMSALSADELLAAISETDPDRIARAPGIGRKTAERIILDLRGAEIPGMPAAGATSSGDSDVAQALAGLGYKKPEISRAIASLPPPSPGQPTAARLRIALQILSGRAGK